MSGSVPNETSMRRCLSGWPGLLFIGTKTRSLLPRSRTSALPMSQPSLFGHCMIFMLLPFRGTIAYWGPSSMTAESRRTCQSLVLNSIPQSSQRHQNNLPSLPSRYARPLQIGQFIVFTLRDRLACVCAHPCTKYSIHYAAHNTSAICPCV